MIEQANVFFAKCDRCHCETEQTFSGTRQHVLNMFLGLGWETDTQPAVLYCPRCAAELKEQRVAVSAAR